MTRTVNSETDRSTRRRAVRPATLVSASGARTQAARRLRKPLRPIVLCAGLLALWADDLDGQIDSNPRLTIDTIIVVNHNVFTPQEARKSFIFRTMNAIRFRTRGYVVRDELLFAAGEPYDSVKVAETERNLRAREIFRQVDIDTARVDGKLAVIVTTKDGWSSRPIFQLSLESEGTWTGIIGFTEINAAGTGNLVHLAYRKDVDRDGVQLIGEFRRVLGSTLASGATLVSFSDGDQGAWSIGKPFYSVEDSRSFGYSGFAASRRVLSYRVENPSAPDTSFFWRRSLIHRLGGAFAASKSKTHYLRLGAAAEVRREEYVQLRDTALAIPDTLTGSVALFAEFRGVRFRETRFFNGFTDEDLDLSTVGRLSLALAPEGWGYRRTGIGPRLDLAAAVRPPGSFIKGQLSAGGLFTDAGLDSGRVVVSLTFGAKPLPRHATILFIMGGLQENPPPGEEFDLGFTLPPRSWEPHSFTGTRVVFGTFEHRWFIWDAILNLVGIGVAFFVDYGGAWYPGQSARFGGNIGLGLRTGGALGTGARHSRLDLGYRFGEDVVGSRWVLSFGPGLSF